MKYFSTVTMMVLASTAAMAQVQYTGSTFSEVLDVLSDTNIPNIQEIQVNQEAKVYQSGQIPQYPVTPASVFKIVLDRTTGKMGELLGVRAVRTLSDRVDYYERLEKPVHSNGICFSGAWEMYQDNRNYSGYFGAGKKGLFVGRASAATGATTSDQKRSFGFAGKIFPTLDKDQKVETANFFTLDSATGNFTKHYLDAGMTNSPTNGLPAFFEAPFFIKVAATLFSAGGNPGFRPVYPISELGLNDLTQARGPKFIRLTSWAGMPRIAQPDFRRELQQAIALKGSLILNIEASEDNSKFSSIGALTLDKSYLSYGCDRRLHFSHPRLK